MSRLRPDAGGVSVADVMLASKCVVVARERAEARFVIEYRQLVSATSMAAFVAGFRQHEVTRAAVTVGAELGRGQSGVVFRGALSGRSGEGGDGTVVAMAVKARLDAGDGTAGGSTATADEALLLEALLLNGLRHPGIVSLLAVVSASAPVLVCTELMANGDLRSYLRRCRPSRGGGPHTAHAPHTPMQEGGAEPTLAPTAAPAVIDGADMVAMAAKLGSAMAFLESQSIVHRDIAARNVLVGNGPREVKMADLGAARNVHRTSEASYRGVYTATTDHAPARWMALEALQQAKFSHKSDVFAFGVLLWEMLSFGQTPWGAFGVREFAAALARGERLPMPPLLSARSRHEHASTDAAAAPPIEASTDDRDGVPLGVHALADAATVATTAATGGGAGAGAGGAGEREGDLRLAEKIYAVAVRCWNETPKKRPRFRQLESELATHATVHHAQVAEGQRGYMDVASVDAGEPAGERARSVILDDDGYVEDVGNETVQPLDADGYVADVGNGTVQPQLDANGYVADAGHLMVRGGEQSGVPFQEPDVLADDFVTSLPTAFAAHPLGANGGASRNRLPSLYLGFVHTDEPSDESRL
jgi:hypothetical protein